MHNQVTVGAAPAIAASLPASRSAAGATIRIISISTLSKHDEVYLGLAFKNGARFFQMQRYL